MQQPQKTVFDAEVKGVFSGDDLTMFIDLGVNGLFKQQRVRLEGVDTPNAVRQSHDSEAGQVRSFVRSATQGKTVQLTVTRFGEKSWVGIITIPQEDGDLNLNEALIAKGYKFIRDKAEQ